MKKVVVSLDNISKGASKEVIHHKTVGKHYMKGAYNYLIYEEKDPDTKQSTKNMLKWDDKSLTLTRSGMINHQQSFSEDEISFSDYVTPYGTLKMKMHTKELAIVKQEATIITVKYSLYINEQWQADNELTIKIKPAQ